MNDNIYETIEYRGFNINIEYDHDPLCPRTEWDNLGTMVCCHSNYTLGDKQVQDGDSGFLRHLTDKFDIPSQYDDYDYDNFSVVKKWAEKNLIMLPLYLYDHSGITMNTGGFSCPWDSGQVGWIYISRKKVREEYSVKRISKKLLNKIIKYLTSEVSTYDNYLTGEVYGFVVEGAGDDSCWGFYGDSGVKDAIAEGKSSIDFHINEVKKAHYKKLKAYIINKVPLLNRESLVLA